LREAQRIFEIEKDKYVNEIERKEDSNQCNLKMIEAIREELSKKN